MIALIVSAVLIAIYVNVPMYRIASGSMEPTLPIGTIVIGVPATDLQVTDIITFQQEGMKEPVTHTFIGYDEAGNIMTKGDANTTPDVHTVPLTDEDVISKLWMTVPILVPSFWTSPKGIGIAILAIVGLTLLLTRPKNDEDEVSMETSHEEVREPTPV